ncbi:hypothetical protein DFJ73DRAFT_766526 [Zopfochytrium polystomum]|nr:hypothetical protein DFJ73DRAFT_766526 [Zopfochytrium polystomum]
MSPEGESTLVLRVILAQGAMLIFSVSFQFSYVSALFSGTDISCYVAHLYITLEGAIGKSVAGSVPPTRRCCVGAPRCSLRYLCMRTAAFAQNAENRPQNLWAGAEPGPHNPTRDSRVNKSSTRTLIEPRASGEEDWLWVGGLRRLRPKRSAELQKHSPSGAFAAERGASDRRAYDARAKRGEKIKTRRCWEPSYKLKPVLVVVLCPFGSACSPLVTQAVAWMSRDDEGRCPRANAQNGQFENQSARTGLSDLLESQRSKGDTRAVVTKLHNFTVPFSRALAMKSCRAYALTPATV